MNLTPSTTKSALIKWAVSSTLAGLLTSCARLTPTREPIPVVTYRGQENRNQDSSSQRLLVFLPGRADTAEDFRSNGMLQAFRQVDSTTDVVAVQVHMGYYFVKRELAKRLHDDLLLPAIVAGKTEITLVDISLGGLGILLIEQQYAGIVVRRVLIAPFAGNNKLNEEIVAAGGVANCQPAAYVAEDAPFRDLWAWLKARNDAGLSVGEAGSTWLLLGRNDRYIAGQELLAQLLAPQQTLRLHGKHSWTVWRPLWEQWLAQHWVNPEK